MKALLVASLFRICTVWYRACYLYFFAIFFFHAYPLLSKIEEIREALSPGSCANIFRISMALLSGENFSYLVHVLFCPHSTLCFFQGLLSYFPYLYLSELA
ncbi:hypothetical protein GE21DRAFT_4713 [Neurospora crassa]|uniref:Uncharacterized protein n=1 Tax=Neurospora crassa (strain ATCC 24698 / 74-OR23-1A / CBS 708.71 / DSM 1257 / FGSC 987) TaxID=367110 RepID=U9W3F6_NEUCR|nr:hypothetical protein NCU16681 [Neurospora crassa OR74A]ESA43357.1 hypothetical protein NCU16681 [Neurospora crassa OR74A]KHE87870.1 hypothetical protein GE21DRAFT_4713 [Neurospora crassa]|eukprot:XP_011394054.1 hypothetical protein NCU16681 [Neurospora crassa OR74A]